MAPLVTKRLITTDEYYKMGETGVFHPDEKTELINGEIYTMAPIGSRHANVVREFSNLLVRSTFDDVIVSNQSPVHIDEFNELQPDIAMLQQKKEGYADAHPGPKDVLLMIEVSHSSFTMDKNVKLPIYASVGIPVYWIISLSENKIEVYEDPFDDEYRIRTLYKPGEQISLLGKSLDVSKILMVE